LIAAATMIAARCSSSSSSIRRSAPTQRAARSLRIGAGAAQRQRGLELGDHGIRRNEHRWRSMSAGSCGDAAPAYAVEEIICSAVELLDAYLTEAGAPRRDPARGGS